MHLGQAAGKLCKEVLEVWNTTTSAWEVLPIKIMIANSGRWIARMEDFYNRRVLLAAEPIDHLTYQYVRLQGGSAEYLLYGNVPGGQINLKNGAGYLYDYSLFNVEPTKADLVQTVGTVSASGMLAGQTETLIGTFPVSMSRFAAFTDSKIPNDTLSKFNCLIPSYAGAKAQMEIKWNGNVYIIQEETLELNLTHLYCVKR